LSRGGWVVDRRSQIHNIVISCLSPTSDST